MIVLPVKWLMLLLTQVSNLKKVLKAIVDYLTDVHGLELDSFIPDVNEIGEKQDEEQMGRLLQLVLGIAIHCDGKEGLTSHLFIYPISPHMPGL